MTLTDTEIKRLEALRERKDLLKLKAQLRELQEMDDILSKADIRFRELKEIIPNLRVDILEAEAIVRTSRYTIENVQSKVNRDALDEAKLTEAIRKERLFQSRLRDLQARLDAAMSELKLLSEVLGVEMPSDEELKPKCYAISTF